MRTPLVIGLLSLTALAALGLAQTAHAQTLFTINANGAKEVTSGGVPNQGEPTATAVGTLILNAGAGSVPRLSQAFTTAVTELYDREFRAAVHDRW